MNKKVKFLSSTLSALLLTSGIALTNVQAQSNNNATVPNSLITTDSTSIQASTNGYNCTASVNGLHQISVRIAADDYEYHNYKIVVDFYSATSGLLHETTITKQHALEYSATVAYSAETWSTAKVLFYADNKLITRINVNY